MSDYKSEWQEIHAQIDVIIRAIPEHFLLDPPDGGDVTVAEGVQRMAARIEQLEAALRAVDDEHGYGLPPETRQMIRAALGDKAVPGAQPASLMAAPIWDAAEPARAALKDKP